MSEPTALDAVKRLRRMLGHVGNRDRLTVQMAIEAITDLSVQLHRATHPLTPEHHALQMGTGDPMRGLSVDRTPLLEMTKVDEAL